jgi:hypothetical protein
MDLNVLRFFFFAIKQSKNLLRFILNNLTETKKTCFTQKIVTFFKK